MSIKTFRQFLVDLQEMSFINPFSTKTTIEQGAAFLRNVHNERHADQISIGDKNYKIHDGEWTHYGHKDVVGRPTEISRFKGNEQQYISKGVGHVKHIIKHVSHHLKTHGEVFTSADHSPGAMHMWVNYIKSNPRGVKFEAIHTNGSSYEVNHKNIDSHVGNIWGERRLPQETKVRAYVSKPKK